MLRWFRKIIYALAMLLIIGMWLTLALTVVWVASEFVAIARSF